MSAKQKTALEIVAEIRARKQPECPAEVADKAIQAARSMTDRELYLSAVSVFKASGYWSDGDLMEYRDTVKKIMSDGSDDDKEAAVEFWRSLNAKPEIGINGRIRAENQERIAA